MTALKKHFVQFLSIFVPRFLLDTLAPPCGPLGVPETTLKTSSEITNTSNHKMSNSHCDGFF